VIFLHIESGAIATKKFEMVANVVGVGRGAHNVICIADSHLSTDHCQIIQENGRLLARDLRSTNGTAIERFGQMEVLGANNQWEREIVNNDVLILGDVRTPVRIRIEISALATMPETLSGQLRDALPDTDDDNPNSSRLIASRSIVDIDAVSKRDAASVAALYVVSQRLQARLEPAAVIDATVAAIFELLPKASHIAVLVRAADNKDRFVLAASKARGAAGATKDSSDPVRASRSVLRKVLATRAGLLTANAQEELSSSESIMGGKILSMLAIPLWRSDEIIGLVQIDNRNIAGMFTEGDLERVLLLGALAALAIDNAGLFSKVRVSEEKARGENAYLRRKEGRIRFENIVGESPAMAAVLGQLDKVLDTRATVCIEGETGTGKELIASAIHHESQRQSKMFVAQNCAALPENLLESELFGHRRGSFTGADSDKKGLFEIADGGTLFLDEVGEMPLALQSKLLRVLQEGTIRAVGATVERQVDVRILCATNRDLAAEVQAGRFRQDLYYRLVVFPIKLPPLRERREDIPALAKHFLARYAGEYRLDLPGFSTEALDVLCGYGWPGNIRELENEVQRILIAAEPGHWVEATDLSPRLRKIEGTVSKIAPKQGTLKEMMDQVERWLIAEALREHGGNKTKTAVTLGITREGLHKKLAKLEL
jgi:transcriptional regulator with GAF, ATPase, and Fis domain